MGILAWIPLVNEVRHIAPDQPLEFTSKGGQERLGFKKLIDNHVPEFKDGAVGLFNPLLPNGHLQTAYVSLRKFSNVDIVYYRRLMLNYKDGGVGALDFATRVESKAAFRQMANLHAPEHQRKPLGFNFRYFTPEELDGLSSKDKKPMLIVMHGLTGGAHEGYVRSLVKCITERYGFEACVLNSRGCGQSSITTPTLYNGLWTEDIRYCVKKLRNLYPNRKFYLVGISLGASMAVNYLGQEGKDSDIACAAVLGNPWDLACSSYGMHRSILGKYLYSPTLGKNCVNLLKENLKELLRDPNVKDDFKVDWDSITTVEQFDNLFTSKMFGFNTSYEYYRYGSSVNRLLQIRTPLLCLNSLDDPIVGSESLPRREVALNPYVLLLETSRGGHIGWIDAFGNRWYVDPLCRFFRAFHDEIASKKMTADLRSVTLPRNNKFQKDRLVNPFDRN